MAPPLPRAPQLPARQPDVTRWLLISVLVVHAAMTTLQPLLAGRYLSGDVDAIGLHSLNGVMLPAVCLVQLVIAVLFWRPAHGPGWPALATVALFFAEGYQIGIGYSRSLGVHIPLGVGIVASTLGMLVWSLWWRPRRWS